MPLTHLWSTAGHTRTSLLAFVWRPSPAPSGISRARLLLHMRMLLLISTELH